MLGRLQRVRLMLRCGHACVRAGAKGGSEEGPEKLDVREIKKMNGKQLKDLLKERGLSTQGQKKELMDRLIEFETSK